MEVVRLKVSEFIALTNQTLEYAYPSVEIEGEVASFKVNQGKYVFFDLKDESGTINCFMSLFQLRIPIEDGMKVIVTGAPKLTNWGRFSVTVRLIRPQGEGALKKSFELLKAKLDKEGLFSPERKRVLPSIPLHVGVITSTGAAGYADFVKIVNDRWGGVRVDVAHVQVQGDVAPDQIIRAIHYFNQQEELPQVLVIIRGGGSADDLAAFNDEPLVRAIATSRIPTLVGVGHEVDESLADLVADVRAATPSNAAQLLVPDRKDIIRAVQARVQRILPKLEQAALERSQHLKRQLDRSLQSVLYHLQQSDERIYRLKQVLAQLDPNVVLGRGYALIRGKTAVGEVIEVETKEAIMKAKVETYERK